VLRDFSAFSDEVLLFFCRHGEDSASLWGQLAESDFVRCTKLLLPLGGAEDVPSLDGYPVDARYVRCGEDALDFEEFGEALGAGGVGDDAGMVVRLFQLDPGEHLAANGFVANPEDQATELLSFDGVGKGEEEGANALDVHEESIEAFVECVRYS
jgi:hypothetical protein